jgi:hypothetical protein
MTYLLPPLPTLLASLTLLAALPAQSGRTMRLQAPVLLGHTGRIEVMYPPAATGNFFACLWSAPFSGSQPVAVPGFTVVGQARI